MATSNDPDFACPFCESNESSEYQLLLHVELQHSEGEISPFAVKDEVSAREQNVALLAGTLDSEPSRTATPLSIAEPEYVECPYKCGENVLADELSFHADLHEAENMAFQDGATPDISNNFTTGISKQLRDYSQLQPPSASVTSSETRRKSSWKDFLSPPRSKRQHSSSLSETDSSQHKVRRLGKAELGPHANEKRMPSWLVRLLEDGARVNVTNTIGPDGTLRKIETVVNETPYLVPVLARLSVLDTNVMRAYYCDPSVMHVCKLPKEGGFCGYRNTQMLVSYIRNSGAPGAANFSSRRLPSILQLQDMIEYAWDQGFNSSGREETGGIRGTRKYIGTPEAQALLLSLGISAEATAYSSKGKHEAYDAMMVAIASHFRAENTVPDSHNRVTVTDRPPLFFQYQGHSLTVVGYEINNEGHPNLVVFDPMYQPSPQLRKYAIDQNFNFTQSDPAKQLKLYRRNEKQLGRRKAFEMIRVNGPR